MHESIHHDGSRRYVRPVSGDEPRAGEQVKIRLRASPDAPVDRVLLRTSPDGEQRFAEMQLEPMMPKNRACQWWQAELKLTMPVTGYRFLIFGSEGAWWYNASGLHRGTPTDARDFRLLAGYQAPAWARRSIFYQIFPDRFADGDQTSNPREGAWSYRGHPIRERKWGEAPATSGMDQVLEFYGGDLAGIEQHLDYLSDLGVDALYLNPVFTAYSNHRYDVIDYDIVDPHLGGNEALISLRRATADRGVRMILDIVPNHCGDRHPWFLSALADPAAPTAEFFTFIRHPEEYACWLGVRSLPKLNYNSERLRELMYAGYDSIFRRWLRPPFSIDGWRIDVANMLGRLESDQLGPDVAKGVRAAVKAERPDAYLLGENFFDSSTQLQGDMWDAAMNYQGFATPIWYWLGQFSVLQHGSPGQLVSNVPWSTEALVETLQAHQAAIPWAIARQQFNLLGSHDTPRILNHVGHDRARNRVAVGIQMTFPGIPSVYYGDENGMSGHKSSSRESMEWDSTKWDHELRAFYRTLIALRLSSSALLEGGFQVLLAEANAFAYLRDSDQEQIVVLCNRGPSTRPASSLNAAIGGIGDGAAFEELFTGAKSAVVNGQLPLPALPPGITVWRSS